MDAFHQLIFTVERVGEEFNLLQMNFGRDGKKSSCEHCKNEKLARLEKNTFETETLYSFVPYCRDREPNKCTWEEIIKKLSKKFAI